ncbi:MAG: AMP-binding protein [Rubrivivax sp.]|nr:AMP-binding protein [Rubrivivax sp.]
MSLNAAAWERLAPAPAIDAAELQLRALGAGAGHIVAWLGHNRHEMLATLAASRRLGCVLMPLNWRLSATELAALLRHAGVAHMIHWPETAALAQAVLAQSPLQAGPASGIEPGDLLLVYTSGTTAAPKGALHTADGMLANARAALAAQGLDEHSRVLAVLPTFHVGGLCIQLLPALMTGAQVLLQPRFEPVAWFDALEQARPSTCLLVPAVMRSLIEHPRWAGADLASLDFVCAGSQIVPPALIEAFHARGVPVAQVYGATETGPVSLVLPPQEAMTAGARSGRPALGVQIRLAADGEILLKAEQMMRGYHRAPGEAFDAEGWFHTGDLALRHADGLYEVVGRSKELIISGGENIHPAEIENLLLGHPDIAECALVGLPDARWGELPVLAVVPQPGRSCDLASLQPVWEGHVARFKHPRQLLLLPELPKTALGKVQRAALVAQLVEQVDRR